MSSTGQIVGGIAGGIIGSFAGKPWLGAQIGMMLGGYLDPGKGPTVNGPTLDDLTVQTSTYGAMIPRLYGTISVTGNVIWLENNLLTATVTKTKSGGKGGQKTVTRTTTYSATFAVALCQGPIVGIRRMWLRSDLVYDAGSSDPSTIIASNQSAEGWTLYTGTDTQGADPRMQATLGVGNTPAWRGLAYIVFEDLQLARYSNSLPGVQVKVEVMMASSPYTWSSTTDALPAYDTWAEMAASPTTAVCVPRVGSSRIAVTHDGRVWEAKSTSTSAHRGCVAFGNGIFIAMREGLGCDKSTDDGETWLQIDSVAGRDWVVNPVNAYPPYSGYSYDSMVYGNGVFCAVSYDTVGVTDDGINWRKGAMPSSGSWNITHNGAGLFVAVNGGTNNAATSADGLTWTARTMAAVGNWSGITYGNGLFVAVGYSGGSPIQTSPDGITWTEPLVTGTHNYHTVSWTREHFIAPGYGSAVASISLDGTTWSDIALPSSQLWEGSQSFLGSTIIVAYNSSISTLLNVTRVGAGEHLSDVVTSECLYSGLLTTDDIQASALTSIVPGYRIGTVGTLRSALEPLQAAWPFDVVQSGYKLKFKPRGSASVATVLAGDLGARESSQGEAVGIVRTREIDSQLPRRLTVRYLDSSREYDIGSQYAERLSTLTVRETTLDLSIVLDSSQAAGKAEVLLYAAWMGRVKLSFTLPDTYRNLEPADVITLPTPDGPMTVRLTTVNYTSDNLVSCSATLDQASTYSPVALGVSPTTTGQTTIAPLGLTTYALLDIPRVSSAQDLVGFPVAMCGGTAWPGGVLMRSSDLGATWAEPLSFGPPGAAIGTASTVIGAVESRLIDVASSLTVTLTSGTLSDVSELSMLNGANYFAYGVAGRWEIIAARTCTLQSGTTYILSNMLRGQFGTEWAMGLHATGDTVVLLDSSELQVLEQSSGDIGAPRTYRAITSGRDISTGSDRSMTYDAVNLKPLSPVYLNGSRHPITNDWSSEWLRRTRVGGEWRDYVDADLGESAQLFEIDIYDGPAYSVVKRTISSETSNANYTSAQQFADFGSIQANIYVKVYQVSSAVGRGYPLTGVLVVGVTGWHFVQTDDIAYFELLPAALQTLNETFGSDTGFTKYTEGTPGTTALSGNKYIVTHAGGRNDIITKNTISFSIPQAWVETTVNVSNTGASGYDNGGVGLVKDASNFIFASMDRLSNIARLQVKIAGSNVFIGSVTFTFGTSFKLGFSLVANSACMWVDAGSGWIYVVGADVAGYYDFRNSGNLTSWKPGFTLANGGGNSTWEFSAFKTGCFGGVGMRDQTLVTNEDATPYLATATAIQFTATSVDPRGVGYCGIYTLDMTSKVLTQTAALMVSRGGKVYNDLACHIIKYAGGNRRVLISTWGNGFGASLQILYGLLTSGDVLIGANAVTLTQLSLPGQVGVSPGCYDPMLAWDASNSRWLIAYTLVDDTSFVGNPFYAALAHSSDMASFTLIAKDSANAGYEGTKIVSDAGALLITAGGPAGVGDRARVYDATLSHISVLDLVLSGGADTQPHAAMFTYAGNRYVLSFDNTRYGGVPFTWGRLRLYMDTV
jgi:hypothetical protein